MSRPDFVSTVLETFQAEFGRLHLSPLDYGTAVAWADTDMPVTIPVKVITEAAQKAASRPKAQRFRLSWLNPDVDEQYAEWRRMMGPYRAKPEDLTS